LYILCYLILIHNDILQYQNGIPESIPGRSHIQKPTS
jgi:hypothetical protein